MSAETKATPFFPFYQKYGAKVIDFYGWSLPVQFSGIIDEHLAVRRRVGLFDVSHMGEILVEGPSAPEYLNLVFTNSIAALSPGSIRYSPLCYLNGGTVDDVLIYRLGEERFLLVVNASNTQKDYEWLNACAADFEVEILDLSDATAQLAVQGPAAASLLADLSGPEIKQLKYYQFTTDLSLDKIPVIISRTGYTGEDGYEVYLPPAAAATIWELIMTAGQKYGIIPIGLGARDTLRLEAGLPLYGHELTADITPVEAGLNRFIDFSKEYFNGKEALRQESNRFLAGLEMIERGIPRSGCPVLQDGQPVGWITSGSYAPFLEKNLALAILQQNILTDSAFQVDIRGKRLAARRVPFPFYKRRKGVSQ